MENALKNIANSETVLEELSEEEKLKVKQKFRSMEELKKEFETMNAQIQTDREILRDLIAKYNTKNSFIPEEAAEKLIFLTVCKHGNVSTRSFDCLVDWLID